MIAARTEIAQSRAAQPSSHATARIGRAGAALDLDRKADEAEAALADELVEIDQPFHVGEAEIAADVMHLEIVAARPPGAHRLDAEHADALACRARSPIPWSARESR